MSSPSTFRRNRKVKGNSLKINKGVRRIGTTPVVKGNFLGHFQMTIFLVRPLQEEKGETDF